MKKGGCSKLSEIAETICAWVSGGEAFENQLSMIGATKEGCNVLAEGGSDGRD